MLSNKVETLTINLIFFGDALIWSVVMLLNASASFHDASAARDVDFEITEILGRMPVWGVLPKVLHTSKSPSL